jgi:NAD(P)H dehydrogenase (quinone)
MTKTVAVTSAQGAQQSAVVSAFAEQGWIVRRLVRQRETGTDERTLVADLSTGDGLEAAFEGVDVVAFTTPQDHRPGAITTMARNVANAASRAGVKLIVASAAGTIDNESSEPFATELRAVRDAIRGGGVPSVFLEPTVYMDNLLAPWALPAIVANGVFAYPAPETATTSWMSHRTLADFFVAAASSAEVAGRDLRIGGPDALTGPQMAEILADHLGRPVAYQRLPLEHFAAGMNQAYGAPAGDRLAEPYRWLEREPEAMARDGEAARLLNVHTESFVEFVRRSDWSLPPT